MTMQVERLEQSEQSVDSAASTSKEHDEARAPDERGANQPESLGHTLLQLVIDVVMPIAVFYGLRAGGVSSYRALLLGAAIPAVSVIVSVVRKRRVDGLGIFVLITVLLSAGVSLLTGSSKFLLVKDGWLTGLWGLWFFVSLRAKRPVTFLFSRPLLEGRRVFEHGTEKWVQPTGESWDSIWARSSQFRRIWRVTTAIWGSAMLVDAAIRVIMAYTLPIGMVPGLGGALWPITFVVLQVVTNVYFYRAGFWRILSGDLDAAEIEGRGSANGSEAAVSC